MFQFFNGSADEKLDFQCQSCQEDSMGCNAAKNLPVEQLDGHADHANGNAVRAASVPLEPSPEMPPLEAEDLQAELLENATVNNVQKTPHGLSFEIAFEEDDAEDSIVKKHPPKRVLERLEEPPSSPVTLSKLQEKLDEAEIRRQQILAQRVQSAKLRAEMKNHSSVSHNEANEDIDFLRIPPEEIPAPSNPYIIS
ncbi:hypothetical protein JTB14_002347 [Gonioctena quinquepunctata]|nr:hypothetical protein JTB14_002347 [Gonioctena quinquepunctata]